MLSDAVAQMLGQPVQEDFEQLATAIATDLKSDAILFYGSSFRTGDREGVTDFYALDADDAPIRPAWKWPVVSYHEKRIGGRTLRAKVARMSLREFAFAASGRSQDTTVWTRFCQPSRLVFTSDARIAEKTRAAVEDAIATGAGFAAALGPDIGSPRDYWLALFEETYGAEFRVEKVSRAATVLEADPDHFDRMLPLAWRRLSLLDDRALTTSLRPRMDASLREGLLRQWHRRKRLGKPLNIARLIRAAFTFEGATRYALWKIERHTGVHFAVTPWRERHPILAAPGVLFRLWRETRS